jgi:F-type H+-transporting ATPase subunit O
MLAARQVIAKPALGRRAASALALKYSKAAYQAALSKSPQTLTQVHSELTSISSSVSSDKQLNALINNPSLSANDRKAGLDALFKEKKFSEVTKNLFTVLSENGRLSETSGVIEGFNELVAKYKGELNVVVTSAAPLPKDILTKLEGSLKQSQTAQQAKTLKVTNKVCLLT